VSRITQGLQRERQRFGDAPPDAEIHHQSAQRDRGEPELEHRRPGHERVAPGRERGPHAEQLRAARVVREARKLQPVRNAERPGRDPVRDHRQVVVEAVAIGRRIAQREHQAPDDDAAEREAERERQLPAPDERIPDRTGGRADSAEQGFQPSRVRARVGRRLQAVRRPGADREDQPGPERKRERAERAEQLARDDQDERAARRDAAQPLVGVERGKESIERPPHPERERAERNGGRRDVRQRDGQVPGFHSGHTRPGFTFFPRAKAPVALRRGGLRTRARRARMR